MAQTLVSLLVHIVFSTKNRANLITPAIEPDLYKYISGTSNAATLKRYIETQKTHHRTRSFEDELRGLLRKYQVEYDERYIWR